MRRKPSWTRSWARAIASVAAILAAGGKGERARDPRDDRPKQLRHLGGRPLWEWSFDVLRATCDEVVVVADGELAVSLASRGIKVAPPGTTRQGSVANGLELIETEQVVVHDAARPFVDIDTVISALHALDEADGAFAAIPVRETLAYIKDGLMTGVVPRQSILSVQTPQSFWTRALKDSHTRALADGISEATDDAQLVANYGYKVVPIQGDARNLKLTYAPDFDLAEALVGGAG
ncbi:MAG: 2-C-methyl-D-erythritol 4-phosphate cytidylyltransferase [Actinomycetota bacterium]|nr:2-C-methyl-D-erythritol 4-phosphate cytidylyltransferase [Actinomycetota bacterium]